MGVGARVSARRGKAGAPGGPALPLPEVWKLAIVADPHVGNRGQHGGEWRAGLNERGRLSVEVLRRSIRAAVAAKASHYVVAGDLFHTRRPDPAEIVAVQRVLAEEAKGIGVLIVPGNHDMLDATAAEGNTACEPLWQEATIVRGPTWVSQATLDLLCVPFHAGEPMRDYLPRVLADDRWSSPSAGEGCARVLVTHVGVYDDASPRWCRDAADSIHARAFEEALRRAGFRFAFVGNYHDHKVWSGDEVTIVQVGTLCPGGFGDAGRANRGLVAFYGGGGLSFEEVPGPRFLRVPQDGEPPRNGEDGCAYYLRVEEVGAGPPEKGDDPTRVEAVDAGEAIAAYVGQMELPGGVARGAVLDLARELWRQS